tara:strand:- start:35 stop:208 length:174 start_codon:yes stop_codon:yes gene_type:complete
MIYTIIKAITILLVKDGAIKLVRENIPLNKLNLNLYNKYKYLKLALTKKKLERKTII